MLPRNLTLNLAACLLICLSLGSVSSRLARADAPPSLQTRFQVLRDQDSSITAQDLAKPEVAARFIPIDSISQIKDFSGSALWIKIEISNAAPEDFDGVLSLDAPQMTRIELHSVTTHGLQLFVAGTSIPWDQLPLRGIFPAFPVRIPAQGHWQGYLRTGAEPIAQNYLRIEPARDFESQMTDILAFLNSYFGFFAALFLINLLVYAYVREPSYLYYLLFEGLLGFTFFLGTGLGAAHFPILRGTGNPLFASCYNLSLCGCILFSRSFLELRVRLPRIDRFLQLCFLLQLITLALAALGHLNWLPGLDAISVVALLPALLGAALVTLRQGYAPARSYLIAWGCLAAGTMIWLAGERGIIPHSLLTFYGPMIGSAFEMLLLSLAIFDRMSRIEHELLVTQEGLTRTLEAKVQQRTRELEAQRAVTLYAAKMSTLGEMAGGLAHEINNPLAIVRIHSSRVREMISELVKGDESNIPVINRALDQTDRAVMRISVIIRSLLSFARSDDNAPASIIRVADLIEQTLQLCHEDFEHKGIHLSVEPGDPALTIECRESQMRQILFNLLTNAADAAVMRKPSWIRLSIEAERGGVQFAVTDSGPGLPENIRERIFEPFFTTKTPGKGPGLGLSVAKGIAEGHHGRLWLDTQSAETRFVLWIPRTQTSGSSIQPSAAETEETQGALT